MIRIEPAGAEALLLVLAEQPDAELPQRIARLAERIAQQLGPVLVDLVPAWTSLLVHYDLLRISHPQLVQQLTPLLEAWLAEARAFAPSARCANAGVAMPSTAATMPNPGSASATFCTAAAAPPRRSPWWTTAST
mgnify:CR=1 FL=1